MTTMDQEIAYDRMYDKHVKCLKLLGLQPKTIDAYARAIRRVAKYFDYQIEDLTMDQLLDYFNDLLESHSWSTVKLDLYGLKYFHTNVLNKTWEDIPIIKKPKATRIPDILNHDQLNSLLAATKVLSYKVFFLPFTVWGSGLVKELILRLATSMSTICGYSFVMPRATKTGWFRCLTRPCNSSGVFG